MGIFDETDDPFMETLKDTACNMVGIPRQMFLNPRAPRPRPTRTVAPQPTADPLKLQKIDSPLYISTNSFEGGYKPNKRIKNPGTQKDYSPER